MNNPMMLDLLGGPGLQMLSSDNHISLWYVLC
jgi:hypothetical protein